MDTATGEEIGQLLLDLNAAGQTLVLVTHSPDLAARYAQRTVRLVDGHRGQRTRQTETDGGRVRLVDRAGRGGLGGPEPGGRAAPAGSPAQQQMLYTFTSAGTAAQVSADLGTLKAALPAGGLDSWISWLSPDSLIAASQGINTPFVVAFAVIGLVLAVLITASVAAAAVITFGLTAVVLATGLGTSLAKLSQGGDLWQQAVTISAGPPGAQQLFTPSQQHTVATALARQPGTASYAAMATTHTQGRRLLLGRQRARRRRARAHRRLPGRRRPARLGHHQRPLVHRPRPGRHQHRRPRHRRPNPGPMLTRERVHDLGVYKAVGMTPRQTVAMVTCWAIAPPSWRQPSPCPPG